MVFNSYIFVLVLLPVCLIGYFGLNHFKKNTASKLFLLGISLWFYGYFHINYIILIIASILINYCSYKLSIRSNKKSLICGITIFINLSILFVFKYYDFFITNINSVFKSDLPLLKILLPLGISFFTFQQIGFTVDASKGKAVYPDTKTPYSFIDYALFVCFFPQLIAGPIVNHDHLIPQFADKNRKAFNYENFYKGFFAFALGLSKKVLIADVLANAVNYGYSITEELNTPSAIFVIIAFTLELYFDFSGYSDMARGLALMLNINLPLNFDSPFKTTNIADFWTSWHITLSSFFTKYVYIPLSGSRKGLIRTYINIFIIFLLSGLWHGANWTFVVWGVINGCGVIAVKIIINACKITTDKNAGQTRKRFIFYLLKKFCFAARILINFLFVAFAFAIFRANSLKQSCDIFKALLSNNYQFGIYPNILNTLKTDELMLLLKLTFLDDFMFSYMLPGFIITAIALIIIFFCKNVNEIITDLKPSFMKTLFITILFIWCTLSFSGISTFIYYNF